MTHPFKDITPLPFSPFVDEAEVDRHNRFIPNQNAMFDAIKADSDRWPLLDWPSWRMDDPPPLFIGAPSDEFVAACHRDLLPLLEDLARRG